MPAFCTGLLKKSTRERQLPGYILIVMTLEAFLQAMVADPLSAPATWLVLADWLDDQDDPRAELVRLMYQPDYHRDLPGEQRDERVRQLLASGVGPVAPALVNSIGMKLLLIPAGTFQMGTPAQEQAAIRKTLGDSILSEIVALETLHEVEISRPYFLGACPVTQEEYTQVTGGNRSYFCASGDGKLNVSNLDTKAFPVEQVSWEEATAFCEALSNRAEEKAAGRVYRLPTEAEWEYACRGGAVSYAPFHFGYSLSSSQANFRGEFPYGPASKGPYLIRTSAVGSYSANVFGLYDMHGNVWEWCHDWLDTNYYKSSPKIDPQGPNGGSDHVMRGGSWDGSAFYCRSAFRFSRMPRDRSNYVGFRVCCFLECYGSTG
jgi:uncharacterized protein (TIGR02996 family)